MNSLTQEGFWELYRALSVETRQKARRIYRLWRDNPSHPSLHFKLVSTTEPLYSVRIDRSYRVPGFLEGDTVRWIWIGPHDEYTKILSK